MIKLLSVAIFAALFLESHQWIPIGPVDPEDPEDPIGPEDPEDPIGPVDPEDPIDPVDPENLMCWTDWFDRDNPSGSGDWELLKDLRKENPGKICEYPLSIEAVTTDTMTPAISTRQTFYIFNPTQGFVCRNTDQRKGMCRDYKVRFGCLCRN